MTESTITINDLRYFLIQTTQKMKQTSKNRIVAILKCFFGWLAQEEYILKNPALKLKQAKVPKRLRKSLNATELELLRQGCRDARDRAILEYLFSTGCRVKEVVNTNVEDIAWNTLSVRVIGKGDKEREVYFNDKTKLYLEQYLENRPGNSKALFTSLRKPYERIEVRALERVVKKIAERSNVDKSVYPHLLRHTMATLGLASGADLVTLQHLLGHENPGTTQIYAETDTETVRHEHKKYLNY